MNTIARPEAGPRLDGSDRLSPRRTVALHLLPGVPSLVGYTLLAALLVPRGLPHILALMLAIGLVEIPLLWGIMRWYARRDPHGWTGVLPYRRPVPGWQYVVLGLPLIVFSVVMVGGVAPVVQTALQPALFAWLPKWFVLTQSPAVVLGLETGAKLFLGTFGALALLAGGATQEIYFRGFLLPGMRPSGVAGPAVSAALFAVYHLIAPWSWPVFFLMVLPWAYLVWWKRSLRLGVFIHVGMLAIQTLGLTLLLLGVAPPGQ